MVRLEREKEGRREAKKWKSINEGMEEVYRNFRDRMLIPVSILLSTLAPACKGQKNYLKRVRTLESIKNAFLRHFVDWATFVGD